MAGKFEPNHKKLGGRTKGTPNKASVINRGIITQLASGMLEQVMKDIAELDPKDRVNVFIKLAEFGIPKPQTIDISLSNSDNKTIEDRLSQLADENEE